MKTIDFNNRSVIEFESSVSKIEFYTTTKEIITIKYDNGTVSNRRLTNGTDYEGKVLVVVLDNIISFEDGFELVEIN